MGFTGTRGCKFAEVAYQKLDGIVFNILNQTKMLFTALFVYLMLGRRQSPVQCCALVLLSFSGVLVSLSEARASQPQSASAESFWMGIFCIVSASALSGFGGAVSEWVLQREQRNSYLFSCEMAVLGCLAILLSRLLSPFADVCSSSCTSVCKWLVSN